MARDGWITLADFSSKYRVSVSTLRRRIKAGTTQYQLDAGKYWLRDLPLKDHKPLKVNNPNPKKDAAPPQTLSTSSEEFEALTEDTPSDAPEIKSTLITTVNSMMEELKKAYMQILQEKEHQIFQLKSEIADLKTLVRVFEDQSEEKKKQSEQQRPKNSRSSWLDLDN